MILGGMTVVDQRHFDVTYRIELSGGQRRLKEAILYVAQKGQPMEFLGRVKLNKIIWRADFRSFYARRQPVTGRAYQKLRWGPALMEMMPIMNDLLREGLLMEELQSRGGKKEHRPVAKADPVLRFFSAEDLEFLDESLQHYWNKTGSEASDESHGLAWKSRNIGDAIPYEAAFFEDKPLPKAALQKLAERARKLQLRSA